MEIPYKFSAALAYRGQWFMGENHVVNGDSSTDNAPTTPIKKVGISRSSDITSRKPLIKSDFKISYYQEVKVDSPSNTRFKIARDFS